MTRTATRRGVSALATAAGMAAAAVMFAGPAHAAGTNLVTNGNFAQPDTVPTDTYGPVTSLPGWTFDLDYAEIQSYDYVTPPAGSPTGTQAVDLNPSAAETITQTVSTTAGTKYVLSFDLGGNTVGAPAQKTGDVSIDGAKVGSLDFDTTGHSRQAMGWAHKSIQFTASGETTIAFTSTTDGIYGPMITNVSVVPATGTPMAAWQIALPLLGCLAVIGGGLAWFRRRRLSTAVA